MEGNRSIPGRKQVAGSIAMIALALGSELIGHLLWQTPAGVAAGLAWGYFMGYYLLYSIDTRWNIYPDMRITWKPAEVLGIGLALGLAGGFMPFSPSTNFLLVGLPLITLWAGLAAVTALITLARRRNDWQSQALGFPLEFSTILFWQLSGMIVAGIVRVPVDLSSGLLVVILPAAICGAVFGYPVTLWLTDAPAETVHLAHRA